MTNGAREQISRMEFKLLSVRLLQDDEPGLYNFRGYSSRHKLICDFPNKWFQDIRRDKFVTGHSRTSKKLSYISLFRGKISMLITLPPKEYTLITMNIIQVRSIYV